MYIKSNFEGENLIDFNRCIGHNGLRQMYFISLISGNFKIKGIREEKENQSVPEFSKIDKDLFKYVDVFITETDVKCMDYLYDNHINIDTFEIFLADLPEDFEWPEFYRSEKSIGCLLSLIKMGLNKTKKYKLSEIVVIIENFINHDDSYSYEELINKLYYLNN